jgi:hypothetical protein
MHHEINFHIPYIFGIVDVDLFYINLVKVKRNGGSIEELDRVAVACIIMPCFTASKIHNQLIRFP